MECEKYPTCKATRPWNVEPGDFAEGDVPCQHRECGNSQQASLRFIHNLKLILILCSERVKIFAGTPPFYHSPFPVTRLRRVCTDILLWHIEVAQGFEEENGWLRLKDGFYLYLVQKKQSDGNMKDESQLVILTYLFISIPSPDQNLARRMSG